MVWMILLDVLVGNVVRYCKKGIKWNVLLLYVYGRIIF